MYPNFHYPPLGSFPQGNLQPRILPMAGLPPVNPSYYCQVPIPQPVTPMVLPVPTVAAPTPPVETDTWTEHTSPDGRTYYYHLESGRSQWDKPDKLKTPDELKVASKTQWKEYVSTDGKKYWHNSVTEESSWDMPDEIKKLQAVESVPEWPVFTTKEEAKQHFMLLLEEKKVSPKARWEDALKIVEPDPRWKSIQILSKGERKQAFSEYLSQAHKRVQQSKRTVQKDARAKLIEFLGTTQMPPDTTYATFAQLHHNQPWWTKLTEDERDELFQDHIEQVEANYPEVRRKDRKRDLPKVREIIQEHQELQYDMPWDIVRTFVLPLTKDLSVEPHDVLREWIEFSKAGEEKGRAERRKDVIRVERVRRDAFIALLDSLIRKERITPRMSYLQVLAIVKDNPDFRNMVGQGGSTPRVLFEQRMQPLKDLYQEQKEIVKKCMRACRFHVCPTTTFDGFQAALKNESGYEKISKQNSRLVFDSLMAKATAKQKAEDEAREKKERLLIEKMKEEVDSETMIQKALELPVEKSKRPDKSEKIRESNSPTTDNPKSHKTTTSQKDKPKKLESRRKRSRSVSPHKSTRSTRERSTSDKKTTRDDSTRSTKKVKG